MLLLLSVLVLSGLLLNLAGCSAATANIVHHRLRDFKESVIERTLESRVARTMPPGTYDLDLGAAAPGAALRFGILERGKPGDPVTAKVYLDNKLVATVKTHGKAQWLDQRYKFPDTSGAPRNCVLRLSSAQRFWLGPCELVSHQDRRPNVLVFLIDALRYDHLNCDGYHLKTAPNIATFATQGVRFTRFISTASWTRPAVASLLTGVFPAVHGAQDRGDVLRKDVPSLPALLQKAGYETHAFMSNPSCLAVWGFARGFTDFVDVHSFILKSGKDKDVVDDAIAALRNVAGRPWFMYVHTIGPHSPYFPPSPYDQKFQQHRDNLTGVAADHAKTVGLYDGEIAFTDVQFGRLMDTLKKLGEYENTMVIVIADHGEEFWDHGGQGHGHTLFDELIHVPCIIKFPHSRFAGRVCDSPAQTVDLAPTILDVLGEPPEPRFQGKSLLGVISHGGGMDRLTYSSLALENHSMYAARSVTLKYIDDVANHKKYWYDLVSDPLEQHPLKSVPPQGARLVRFASSMNVRGAPGLHVLVTGSLLSKRTVTGEIKANGLGNFQMQYSANNGQIKKNGNAVDFRVTLAPGPNCPVDIVHWHEKLAEQNHAHIHIVTTALDSATLSVHFDGKPVAKPVVHIGKKILAQQLDHRVVPVKDLLANPDAYAPEVLPRQLGVYIWYVPRAVHVPDSKLNPGMLRALRALGYIN